MADGFSWDDLSPELEGPGVGIRLRSSVFERRDVTVQRTEA